MGVQISGDWIFNGVVSIAVCFIGMWLRSVKETLNELKNENKEMRHTFQSKEVAAKVEQNLQATMTQILVQLKMLNEKLDKKADK
ncbi:hypothetical protein CEP49_06705 [Mergibacter septicus]|uniref:hypothetical protein n=1 Tax=Mergibacter septicus TaxID=221402 RepID=UPI0011793258|nr:hypothetical protein [Mergibacter septicus]AWX14261.1 hypothetical protein CEP49_06705 [Mergibacter septicus]